MTTEPTTPLRAIPVLRVSEEGDRGDRLASPDEQLGRIHRWCDYRGATALEPIYERDVSGHAPLERRPLLKAIEMVERHEAEAIVFAYSDRKDRSVQVGAEIVERMDAANALLIVGDREVTHKTAAGWRASTMDSLMSEDSWRTNRERSINNVTERVALGVVPFPLPPGFIRNSDGTAKVDEDYREAITTAYRLRLAATPFSEIRRYLAEQGLEISYRQTQNLFKSKLYKGVIEHGAKLNEAGIANPHVDEVTWQRVHDMRTAASTGPAAPSDRLLARLGVLRCAGCGARMVAGGQTARWGDTTRRYAFYKCGNTTDCPNPCTVSADKLEAWVVERTAERTAYLEGIGTAGERALKARQEANRLRGVYESKALLAEVADDVRSVLEGVKVAKANWRAAEATADKLKAAAGRVVVNAAEVLRDPGSPRELKRLIIANTWESITVRRGRLPIEERVSLDPTI